MCAFNDSQMNIQEDKGDNSQKQTLTFQKRCQSWTFVPATLRQYFHLVAFFEQLWEIALGLEEELTRMARLRELAESTPLSPPRSRCPGSSTRPSGDVLSWPRLPHKTELNPFPEPPHSPFK